MTKYEWTLDEVASMFNVSVSTVQRKCKLGLDRIRTDDPGNDRTRMRQFFLSIKEMKEEDVKEARFKKELDAVFIGARKHPRFDNPWDVLDLVCAPADDPLLVAWSERNREDINAPQAIWFDIAFSLTKVIINEREVGMQTAIDLLKKKGMTRCMSLVIKSNPQSAHAN